MKMCPNKSLGNKILLEIIVIYHCHNAENGETSNEKPNPKNHFPVQAN